MTWLLTMNASMNRKLHKLHESTKISLESSENQMIRFAFIDPPYKEVKFDIAVQEDKMGIMIV